MDPMQHVARDPDANGNYFATFPDRAHPQERGIRDELSQVIKDKGSHSSSLGTAISWPGAPNVDGIKSWFDNGYSGGGPRHPTIPLSYVNAIIALPPPRRTDTDQSRGTG